ncbi:MAG: rhomboid family intramembrane serine protease [Gemmatimonadales bacterium]
MWDEMRYDSPRRHTPFSLTPWVRGLILANAVVYLLTVTVFTGAWVLDVGAFWPGDVGGRWWTFVTYAFLHGGFLHLLFNMILLFFFGPAVEERMGGKSFAAFYFTCGVGGAILSLIVALLRSADASVAYPIVGASGAVLGVALAFAVVGLLFCFIYLKSEEKVLQHARQAVRRQPRRQGEATLHRIKEPMPAAQTGRRARESARRTKRYDEMDRVLDKISQSGLESLTPEERKVLDDASRKLRRH